MASMNNNWLGFSLSPYQQQQVTDHGVSANECFDDLTSRHDSATLPSLNLPPHFSVLEAFNRNHHHHPQDWNMKEVNVSHEGNYKTSSEMSILLENNASKDGEIIQKPKLENFLGISGYPYNNYQEQNLQVCNNNNDESNPIGLSKIKNWLRNNNNNNNTISSSEPERKNDGDVAVTGKNGHQSLTLSMSTGSQSSSLPLIDGGGGGGGKYNGRKGASPDSQSGGAIEAAVTRKAADTFGQRTSIYRGVTRHRWTGRYEAHLWDNSCRREGQTRKGRQVYLGGYDKEEKAARAYDLAALKYWGTSTTTNFPICEYEKEVEEMKNMTRQEFVASLRRKSSGFSRGASIYRGVTRHHQHGRWQARIGRVAGNKDLYLGTFSTQEEAAEAYDIAAIKFRGLNAVTNFEISRYDVKSILESSTLPIGGVAKRLKDAEQQAEMCLEAQRTTDANNLTSLFTDSLNSYSTHHGWPTIAYQQPQPLSAHYTYPQPRLMYKQEHDTDLTRTFQDLNDQIQLGNAHNFLQHQHHQQQPSVLHNLMSLDSLSIERSPDSSGAYNPVMYGSTTGGYMLPMATVIAQENNGYGDHSEVKSVDYENTMMGSTDSSSYQARNFYYQQHYSNGTAKASSGYDESSLPWSSNIYSLG